MTGPFPSLSSRFSWAGSVRLGFGILSIASERAQAVFVFLGSSSLLGHGSGTSLGGCWLGLNFWSAILTVLSLVGVETFHVIVKLLLTRLLEPDRLLGITKSLPLVSDQLGEVRQGQLWVFSAECRASVIIVEHICRERSLKFVPVGILDYLLFGLLLLLFLSCFSRGATNGSSRSRLLLVSCLAIMSAARCGLV